MGKATGFLEYERRTNPEIGPQERIKNYEEFHSMLPKEIRLEQAARCMDCGVPFCQAGEPLGAGISGCPLNNLVPEWNDMIYMGNTEKALERLRKTNNFPEFTGRVCPALCEAACTCGLNGDPVSSKENELSIIESAYEMGLIKPVPPQVRTGKKVAIIGSGASGLAAADQLNRRGHEVTVFEREDRFGGLLMYGIPNMKLDKQVIMRKIDIMEKEGIIFKTGVDVGKDIAAEDLKAEFDGVILCCGASNPRDLLVKGREAEGVYFAVDFLKATTKSLLDSNMKDGNAISAKGKNVIVIGGGDTGNDCVGTAIRHGCKSVVQLEMMPKPPDSRSDSNPWPQWPLIRKTDYGQEESISVFGYDPRIYQRTVTEIFADENGKLCKAKTMKYESNILEDGRFVMAEVKGSEEVMEADLVLIAIGFMGSEDYICEAFGVEKNPRTNVDTENGRYKTSAENVFTAGDMHRGQSLVVLAITEGRGAAKEVDEYLMGYSNLE